jgi:hypothetical protein
MFTSAKYVCTHIGVPNTIQNVLINAYFVNLHKHEYVKLCTHNVLIYAYFSNVQYVFA